MLPGKLKVGRYVLISQFEKKAAGVILNNNNLPPKETAGPHSSSEIMY
jgi:hypothetical protein